MLSQKRILLHVNKLSQHFDSKFVNLYEEESNVFEYFVNRGWKCYFADWHNINFETLECSMVINADTMQCFHCYNLNHLADIIIARSLGSVEAQYDKLARYFMSLDQNFKGAVINHPQAMMYGMNKLYFFDLTAKGIPIIESKYFNKTRSYKYIICNIPWDSNRAIIKPVSGECGNSVTFLSEINESILRRKEEKVRGWIVQPFVTGILLGERSLIYVDKEFVFAVKKTPAYGEFRVNERWNPKYDLFEPSTEEMDVAQSILDRWPFPLHLVRIDLVLDDGIVRIMEVETVNPGFLYIKPSDDFRQLMVLNRLERLASSLVESPHHVNLIYE
jgi:glutathione synthase/RimK-type ligase-like ATP-grasp enzyme